MRYCVAEHDYTFIHFFSHEVDSPPHLKKDLLMGEWQRSSGKEVALKKK